MVRFRLRFFAFLLMAVLSSARGTEFQITSPDFASGAFIPARFTCENKKGLSPMLVINGVPPGTQSLALMVDDPDAPSGTFTHWLVWDIPAEAKELRWADAAVQMVLPSPHSPGEASNAAAVGTNDFGGIDYSGPCPPSGTHRYFFRLFALNTLLHLRTGASRRELEAAMHGHVVGSAVLMGRYAKTSS